MKTSTFFSYLSALLLGVCLAARPGSAWAQTYTTPFSGSSTITTCSGTLYDDGGASGLYSASADGTVTILPATTGNKVKLDFTTFNVESNYDYLYIYDGTSTSAPLIGTYSGSIVPGTVYGTTSSGALTVRFISDYIVQLDGFAANISCVTSVPMPDLTIQSATISPTATVAGGYVSASSLIYNLSGGTASSSNVGYYLSTDNTLSSNDQYLSYSSGGALSVGQSSSRYASLTLPASLTAGTYYILFVADYQNQVAESNENNNVSAVALTVQPSAPDLVIQSPSLSVTSVQAGAALSFYAYIYNQGNAIASSSSVGFYLSSDNQLDANDALLTSQYGSSLTASNYSQRNGTAAIPSNTAAGTYYILFVADYQNQVAESNENNNVSAVSFTVSPPGPDLTVSSQYLSSTYLAAGGSTTASAYINNSGNQVASSSNLGFYLSTNTTFDASDVAVGSSAGTALAAGGSSYRSATLTIPTTTAAGNYYLLFVADPANAVTESNENNNVVYSTLTVYASTIDLTVYSAYLGTTQAAPGGTVSASGYEYNQGNTTAGAHRLGYYLSANTTLDASDVLIGSSAISQVYASYTTSFSATLTIPSNTAVGSYYVLFVADDQNVIVETSKTNNIAYQSLQVVAPGIDLTISSAYLSTYSTTATSTVTASCYLNNQGSLTANSATAGYYLSTNSTFDASDVLLGSSPGVTVAAYGSVARSATLTIPAATTAGNYYVLFVADPANAISETNETNNVSYQYLTVYAPTIDLTVYSATLGATQVAAGNTVSASGYEYNQGNTTAGAHRLGYYLSANTTLDASDVLIGSSAISQVYASYTASFASTLTIPSNTANGTYYVLFVADDQNVIAESNENNNVAYQSLTVAPPSVDLYMYSGYLSSSYATAGNTISTTGYLYNIGNAAASPATVGYYLSTNTILDSSDQLIGNSSLTSLNAGGYAYVYGSATVPANTSTGTYYVLFVADYLNQLTEPNKTNNVAYAYLQVTGVGPDLIMTSPTVVGGTVAAGASVSTSAYIYNQGNGSASNSNVGYYLSTNTTLDASDLLLTTSTGGILYSQQSSYRSVSLAIPSSVSGGSYYVLFVADPTNLVAETNENNNVAYASLTVTGPFTGTVVPFSGTATITSCSATVYDNGGSSAYASNSSGTLTINPATANGLVSLTFSSFDTELGADYLTVYDGTTTSAAQLGTFSGSTLPPTLTASYGNTSGALTLKFTSDGSVNNQGFAATVSCNQRLATLPQQTAGYDISVLPNPVAGGHALRVQLSGAGQPGAATLTLHNSLGQLVATKALTLTPARLNEAELSTTGLATGVYVLRLSGSALNVVRRVVVE